MLQRKHCLTRFGRLIVGLFCTTLLALPTALVQEALAAKVPKPPAYNQLRYKENYLYLKDPSRHTDPFDSIKYMPFNRSGDAYLTLGGETRQHFEFINNPNWGAGKQDSDGYWLQRYMLHSDVHLGKNLRVFTTFKSGLVSGKRPGPGPVDQDDFDLHQAFLDYTFSLGKAGSLTVRGGRQEIIFGSRRFINYRERPNVRFSHDGLRLMWHRGTWDVSAFATRPIGLRPGVFDDKAEDRQTFWGLYSVKRNLPFRFPANMDLYYLALNHEQAKFDQGTADETRHAIGTRLWGRDGHWDYNFEFMYQFGTFGAGQIHAWTAASNTGYSVTTGNWNVRFSVRAEAMSGDDDPNDKNLQTFNPFFPRGKHISQLAASGLLNQLYLHPRVELKRRAWLISISNLFLWRENPHDGLYSIGKGLLRTGQKSNALYVGSQPEFEVKWQVNRHLALKTIFNYFYAGAFLKQTQPAKNITYLGSMATFVF